MVRGGLLHASDPNRGPCRAATHRPRWPQGGDQVRKRPAKSASGGHRHRRCPGIRAAPVSAVPPGAPHVPLPESAGVRDANADVEEVSADVRGFFIDRPIFAWVIALVILLGGALALRQPIGESWPSVAPPALAITVNYPGASAQVVEETAVALIEQEMNGIERLLYMESASELGIGTITLTFEAGTNLDLVRRSAKPHQAGGSPAARGMCAGSASWWNKAARNYLMFIFRLLAGQDARLRRPRQLGKSPPTCWRTVRRVPRGRGDPVRHRVLDALVAEAGGSMPSA